MEEQIIEIRKIEKIIITGKILIPPIPVGFECYPVYYKNNPYVVQIKVNLNEIRTIKDSCKIICAIYEYGADKKLFRGHRRRLVYKNNNPYVDIGDNRNLDIREASEKELITYLPQIFKSLFAEYENHLREEDKEEKQQEGLEQWDGVIDELDKPKQRLETLEACKRPVLENGLILGKTGGGKVFSAKIDTLNEEETRNETLDS